jgi:hypothetical protein
MSMFLSKTIRPDQGCAGSSGLQPRALGRDHSGDGGMGVTTVAECGPGKVLAGLTKRCADGVAGVALADRAAIEANLGLE